MLAGLGGRRCLLDWCAVAVGGSWLTSLGIGAYKPGVNGGAYVQLCWLADVLLHKHCAQLVPAVPAPILSEVSLAFLSG